MEIEMYLYVLTAEAATFYEIREKLLLEVAEIVETSGGGFAGPTEFLYLAEPGEAGAKDDAAGAALRRRNPTKD